MKKRFLLSVICITGLTCSASEKLLELDFEKARTAKGAVIGKNTEDSIAYDKAINRNSLLLRDDGKTFDFSCDSTVAEAMRKSFTLSFRFCSDKIADDYFNETEKRGGMIIFSSADLKGGKNLSLSIGPYNRLFLLITDGKGDSAAVNAKWDIAYYPVTTILRGRWYTCSVVYDSTAKAMEIFLDGISVGKTQLKNDFAGPATFCFGSKDVKNRRSIFEGAITDISISSGCVCTAETSAKALKEAQEKQRSTDRQEFAAKLIPEDPSWEQMHPRMLLPPGRLEQLRRDLSRPEAKPLFDRLISECGKYIDPASPDFFKGSPSQHDIKELHKLPALALASLLTGDPKYAKFAGGKMMESVKDTGYSDMRRIQVYSAAIGKAAVAYSLTYDWGYRFFTPAERMEMRRFLLEIAAGTYDLYNSPADSAPKRDSLSGWVANWSAMSYATLGITSLAVLGETDEPVKKYLDYALVRAMQYGLFACGRDGAFHENFPYFNYGASPLVIFLDAYGTAGGQDLLEKSNFLKYPEYLAFISYPFKNTYFEFKYGSMGLEGPMNAEAACMMFLLRNRANSQAAEWLWQKSAAECKAWEDYWSLLNIVWHKPETVKLESPGLPNSRWFRDEGIVAFRSGWDKDAVAGAFIAYPAKIMAHDQVDRGQFVLCGYQGNWIIDPGGRQLPQFAFRNAHNLISVDGGSDQFKPMANANYHHDAFMTVYCDLEAVATLATADLSQSYRYVRGWSQQKYDKHGKEGTCRFDYAYREIAFIREKSSPNYLVVHDRIRQDDDDHVYTLNLHTAPENRVSGSGSDYMFEQSPANIEKIGFVRRPFNSDGSVRDYYGGNPRAGYAEYMFTCGKDGEYDLYGFGCPGDKAPGGSDSFFVQINSLPRLEWSTNAVAAYAWQKITVKPAPLKSGENKLTLLMREPEAKASRFVLVPAGQKLPDLNALKDPGMILIDAANPDKIVKDFEKGEEKKGFNIPAAFMQLKSLAPIGESKVDIIPGQPLAHYRIQLSAKGKKAEFLNFFYPGKPGMEKPEHAKISDSAYNIKWNDCTDTISVRNIDGKNVSGEYASDASLMILRKKGGKLLSFALSGATFLDHGGMHVLRLEGGEGSACWNDSSLSLNGRNVTSFTFRFPKGSGIDDRLFAGKNKLETVTVFNRNLTPVMKGDSWGSEEAVMGESILTW